jgi:uncharacterized protein YbbC (DUF1343 family)
MMKSRIMIKIGLELFEEYWPKKLRGVRVGLLTHPASVNHRLEHAIDLFIKSRKIKLKALFGPQHGIRGETQDNMIEWKGFKDQKTGITVYSLYSHTRKPEPSMLDDIDVIVVDLQDIGSRYYTFIWTMDLCMEACADMGKAIVILDRPNPVGGSITEGPVLDVGYASFVARRAIPVRHGMTTGEIGNYLKNEFYPDLEFHIIPMKGWRRKMWFDDTDLPWVMPSPNMPTLDTATVYPGMCLLEGTNLSEGRGTTRPFEIFGAPFIDPEYLIKALKTFRLSGVIFRPLFFQPTFQKYTGEVCGGAQIYITDRDKFKPFKTGVAILKAVYNLYPEDFRWKSPPYEYESVKMPIDILAGTDRLRRDIEEGGDIKDMEEWWEEERKKFEKIRRRYLIYK